MQKIKNIFCYHQFQAYQINKLFKYIYLLRSISLFLLIKFK